MSWLDRQTREELAGSPPDLLTAQATEGYTLFLLRVGEEVGRLVRAARRVRRCDEPEARRILNRPLPLVVATGLLLDDAMLGQFEFICVDAITVFVRDEVASGASRNYLRRMFRSLQEGSEFGKRPVEVRAVPENEEGRRYLDQFLGMATPTLPLRVSVHLKKARIMRHWAQKIGADVR